MFAPIGDDYLHGLWPPCYREYLPHMSIRIFTKYFRVAYEAYEAHFRYLRRRSWREQEEYAEFLVKSSVLTDMEFFRRYQHGRHGGITDETDYDSVEAFKEMAFDHYGIEVVHYQRELGHYDNFPGGIKALQILHDNLVERWMAGKLREMR